jgi:transcriptional regulator with XRE-family HTH domain
VDRTLGADLGRGIADARRARGLTQSQLAEQGGSPPWLAKLEASRSTPVLEHLLRRRLGVTITLTYDGDDGQA